MLTIFDEYLDSADRLLRRLREGKQVQGAINQRLDFADVRYIGERLQSRTQQDARLASFRCRPGYPFAGRGKVELGEICTVPALITAHLEKDERSEKGNSDKRYLIRAERVVSSMDL